MLQVILKFLEIFLLIILCVLAVLGAAKETKDENKHLNKWGKITVYGIITTCILQIAVYLFKEEIDNIEKEKQKVNYELSIKRLNNIIENSDMTLKKQDVLQNSSKSILLKVEKNLGLQAEVFDGQKSILNNTERSLSPISNLRFQFTLEYHFENPLVKNIVSEALFIKKKFEDEHNLQTQNPYKAIINGYLFNFDSTHVISFNSGNSDLIRKHNFIFPTIGIYFYTNLKSKPNLSIWAREGVTNYNISSFSINFDKEIMIIDVEPTNPETLHDGGRFIGFKDFIKSTFLVYANYFSYSNEIINKISFKSTFIINGGKKYLIEFNENERVLRKNSLPNTYIHVIKDKEFRY